MTPVPPLGRRPGHRRRAVRRRTVGDDAARRSRRRRDQARGPRLGRRRRPLRAAAAGGRGLGLLRVLQPQQAQRLARPALRGGREVFLDLVAHSDAVLSNLKGGQAEKLGLTYAQLRERNPRIVCCSLTGFGATGPRAAEGGYDYVMQGMAGWMHITGDPDGPPTKSGLSLVDLSAGYVSSIAILSRHPPRAPRRERLRLRHLAVRDRALRAGLRRLLGGDGRLRRAPDEGLRAPVARALPGLRDRGRLDHGRLRQGEVLARAVRGRRAPGAGRSTRATPRSPTATATATSCCRSSARCSAGGPRRVARAARRRAASRSARSTICRPRSPTRRPSRAGTIVDVEHPRLGTVRHIASPLRLDERRRRSAAPRPAASTRSRSCATSAATPTSGSRSSGGLESCERRGHDRVLPRHAGALEQPRAVAGRGRAVDELRERDQLVLRSAPEAIAVITSPASRSAETRDSTTTVARRRARRRSRERRVVGADRDHRGVVGDERAVEQRRARGVVRSR